MMEKWCSRKLAFAALVVVAIAILAALGSLPADAAADLLRWVAGAYLGAQGAVDVAERVGIPSRRRTVRAPLPPPDAEEGGA